jgi:hypothetical protein
MSNVNDLIDWFEFSLSESDKIRVQVLDSIRNKDNENEINAEISLIYDRVSPFSLSKIANRKESI